MAQKVVVLVDDDADDLFIMEDRLKAYDPHLATITLDNARDAIDLLVNKKKVVPEAVFIDINMPGMSGLELIPEVKSRRPDLPVFMISAYGDESRVKMALERGASKFITKPVDFPQLKQDVSRVVAEARASG